MRRGQQAELRVKFMISKNVGKALQDLLLDA